MSPQLLEVLERARREPEGRFHALAHRIDVPALERAYHRMRKDAAVGVDGVTKEQYGQDLERNLRDLHARMKAKRYRHQPIRRVHIPKAQGKTRPIGISAFEDKLVQDAVREVLEAIYEQDFLDCSYGFRPGRSAHDAVRTLNRVVHQGKVNWILEADIVSFFDSLVRKQLSKMLEVRVADGSLLRLIGNCLHVGVLDGVELSTSDACRVPRDEPIGLADIPRCFAGFDPSGAVPFAEAGRMQSAAGRLADAGFPKPMRPSQTVRLSPAPTPVGPVARLWKLAVETAVFRKDSNCRARSSQRFGSLRSPAPEKR
ncbi:MAG: hypothetical protein E6K81_16095 [Candidatus Eisenbacteria bacterium]|uniref:Reverse transcriptase domain-containing protein n=1 Tax=Eiseniibacteriota bacterium TaxID=2212470 RepID=A0A538TZ51_UNCEI|nr:MAG: hypothetical protein E6K81_16095 [Candidatus Eisenbacteria bacterium]